MSDTIKVEILDDGTLRMETEGISMANHRNADAFVNAIIEMIGPVEKTPVDRKTTRRSHHATH